MSKVHIENEVIIGKEDYLFLAGGKQSVLDYITEKKIISSESYRNFSENIRKRKNKCNGKCEKYFHLVLPDKQSVLKQFFPIEEYICLGEEYKKSSIGDFYYPKKILSSNGKIAFLKNDTHFSNYGKIEISLFIAKLAGIIFDQVSVRKTLHEVIFKSDEKILGDLGSKLTKKIYDQKYVFNPSWPVFRFSNKISYGNNGIIDLLISPYSMTNKRLLIFGDSFLRCALYQLSYFFKEILFCRTAFFHEEIFIANRPDIVITENVERYLSFVHSDHNAINFLMTPYFNEREPDYSGLDFSAIVAVLSYGKKIYYGFYDRIQQKIAGEYNKINE